MPNEQYNAVFLFKFCYNTECVPKAGNGDDSLPFRLSLLMNRDQQAMNDLNHLETFFSMTIITAFAAVPHVFFTFFYLFEGIHTLMWVNIVSLAVYGIAFLLLLKRVRYVSSFIVTVEVIAYALISVYYIGWESGSQWFMLVALLPHYLFSDVLPRHRLVLTVVLAVCLNGAALYGLNARPLVALNSFHALQIVNLNILVMAIVFELLLSSLVKVITERIHQKRLDSVRIEALQDPMTGMWNRRYVDDCFDTWFREQAKGQAVLVMLDMDNFKDVNDHFGHDQGDVVLAAFAQGARTHFRYTDLLIRWGGDEFLFILHNLTTEQAYRAMEKLRQYFRRTPLKLDEHTEEYVITFSAGIAVYDPVQGMSHSLKQCDQRLYIAKQQGRDQITWNEA